MRALNWFGVIFTAVIAVIVGAVSAGSASAQTLLETQGTLAAGDAVLDDGSLYDQYTFSSRSGQRVVIYLESGDFDPYLILLDPQGRRISENDDISASNRNSRLDLILPATGTYTVVANSYESGKNGLYKISVDANSNVWFNGAGR
jgi:hypothetical protein